MDVHVFPMAARAEVFYDQLLAEGLPDDYYGFAVGTSLAYKKLVWDIAYQYRDWDDVGCSMLEHKGFSQDVREQKVYISLIVHF